MEISPLFLSLLLLHSFLFGVFLGGINDLNRIVRVFFGVSYSPKTYRSLYTKELPWIHRPLQKKERSRVGSGALSVLIFFQDVFLFLIAALGVVLLEYQYNSGRFRFFVLPAMLLGFVLYYFTVGKCLMTVSEAVVFFIKAALLIVGRCFLYPFIKLFGFILNFFRKITKKFRICIAKRRKKLYNIHVKKKWLCLSKKGFVSFLGKQ